MQFISNTIYCWYRVVFPPDCLVQVPGIQTGSQATLWFFSHYK